MEKVTHLPTVELKSFTHTVTHSFKAPPKVFDIRCFTSDSDPYGSFITRTGDIMPISDPEDSVDGFTPMHWEVPINFDFT